MHGLEAMLSVLGQGLKQHHFHGSRDGRIDLARGRSLMRDVLDDDLPVALAAERHLAGEHLEQDDPQRVDVRAVIDLNLPFALLRRHVVGRSHHRSGAGLVSHLLLGLRQLGQAKVQDLHEIRIAAT